MSWSIRGRRMTSVLGNKTTPWYVVVHLDFLQTNAEEWSDKYPTKCASFHK
jgi:hypothetical protein